MRVKRKGEGEVEEDKMVDEGGRRAQEEGKGKRWGSVGRKGRLGRRQRDRGRCGNRGDKSSHESENSKAPKRTRQAGILCVSGENGFR